MEFMVKIADGGHSLVNVSLEYKNLCSPDDSTLIRVKVICKIFGNRRISAISIHITIPEDEVIEIHPKERVDPETVISEVAVREREITEYGLKSLGVNLPAGLGVEVGVGATKGKDREVAQKGTMYSRKIITGNIIQKDTVCWGFTEAVTAWGGNGLTGEQGEMWFILKGKPDKFEYNCRITHIKGQKERTKQTMSRSWFQRMF
ncbi:hypothetical protein VKT23_015062 [Stygiomarasmius scandens]|uniref:Uncharacterized protein n=1 Tax=Marasmiellus scandens TaxID=2682957 RepID=A0ABR1J0V8_9AGAR